MFLFPGEKEVFSKIATFFLKLCYSYLKEVKSLEDIRKFLNNLTNRKQMIVLVNVLAICVIVYLIYASFSLWENILVQMAFGAKPIKH